MAKMKRLPLLLAALCGAPLVVCGSAVARADNAADGKPADAAVAKAADLSNPKAAALTFARALLAGDAAGVRTSAVGSDADYKIMDAVSKLVGAMKRLNDAATDKFGKDNEVSKGTKDSDLAAKLERSEVKVEGDTATVVDKEKPEDKTPLKLVKKDGQWKVDLGSIPKENIDQLVKLAPAIAKATDEVAHEIKDGKHKTAKDAQEAISQKMMAAMMQAAPQGPQPAPAPPAK